MTRVIPTYPNAKQDPVFDDFHGSLIHDPYRWLEDPQSDESRAWTEAQNKISRGFFDPGLKANILQRLQTLSAYTRWSTPFKRAGALYFWCNQGLQNQPVLYRQAAHTEAIEILDPNRLSESGIVSITHVEPSPDGRYLAYSRSQSGSDWQQIWVRDLESMQDLPTVLMHTKFSGIAWKPDSSGFYYNRYPDPANCAAEETNYFNKVYFHELHQSQDQDTLIYERPDQKDWDFWPHLSEDGQYLLLSVHLGTDRRNGIFYKDLTNDAPFVELLPVGEAQYRFLGNIGSLFYFQSDYQASRSQILAIDLNQTDKAHWRSLIPESEQPLTHAIMVKEALVTVYLQDAHHRVSLFDLHGQFQRQIDLPTIGSVDELHGKQTDSEFFMGFSSFLFPARSYAYDLNSHELSLKFAATVDFAPEHYLIRQEFTQSKDGTRIPMFVVHKKDLQADGQNPTILYGYGGFRHAMTPGFTASLLPWLEQGGIYCLVNLRGGSEYGTEWYKAGTLERKQNVFDDFIAAGEYLIKTNWTSAAKLSLNGGSNGGLLVAACMLQRPDLIGAVVCQVPVLDMLRYHRFTIGRYWASDYGNAEENPEHFEFLIKYSPLHNVKAGQAYPPILLTTADHDDRVVPAHAYKFAATMQAANPANTVLLRVDTDAGHGRGKPLNMVLEERADVYSFLAQTLGMKWV